MSLSKKQSFNVIQAHRDFHGMSDDQKIAAIRENESFIDVVVKASISAGKPLTDEFAVMTLQMLPILVALKTSLIPENFQFDAVKVFFSQLTNMMERYFSILGEDGDISGSPVLGVPFSIFLGNWIVEEIRPRLTDKSALLHLNEFVFFLKLTGTILPEYMSV